MNIQKESIGMNFIWYNSNDYNSLRRYSLVELNGENISLRNFTPGDAEEAS